MMKSNLGKFVIGKAEIPNECPWCGAKFENFNEVVDHADKCSEKDEEDPEALVSP